MSAKAPPCLGFSLSLERGAQTHPSTVWCLSCRICVGKQHRGSKGEAQYSEVFSPAELRFLASRADAYGWYVFTEETREMIQALCARGLMAANGDVKVTAFTGSVVERRRLAGRKPRYYELVGKGCLVFRALQREAERKLQASLGGAEQSVH